MRPSSTSKALAQADYATATAHAAIFLLRAIETGQAQWAACVARTAAHWGRRALGQVPARHINRFEPIKRCPGCDAPVPPRRRGKHGRVVAGSSRTFCGGHICSLAVARAQRLITNRLSA